MKNKRVNIFYNYKSIEQIAILKIQINKKRIFEHIVKSGESILVVRSNLKVVFEEMLKDYHLDAQIIAMNTTEELENFFKINDQFEMFDATRINIGNDEVHAMNWNDKGTSFSIFDITKLIEYYTIKEFDLLSKEIVYNEYVRKYEFEKAKQILFNYNENDLEHKMFAIQKNIELGYVSEAQSIFKDINTNDLIMLNEYNSRYPDAVIFVQTLRESYGKLVWEINENISISFADINDPMFNIEQFADEFVDVMYAHPLKKTSYLMIEIVRSMMRRNDVSNHRMISQTFTRGYFEKQKSILLALKVLGCELISYAANHKVNYNSILISGEPIYIYLNLILQFPGIFGPGSLKKQNELFDVMDLKKEEYIPRNRLIKASKRSSKVAVCISGMTRYSGREYLENIKYMLGDLDADFFIHTWDTRETYVGTTGFGVGETRQWTRKFFRAIGDVPDEIKTVRELKEQLPETSKILLERREVANDAKLYEDILGDQLKSIKLESNAQFDNIYPEELKFLLNFNQAKMFYGINETCKQMEAYEAESGTEYEYIIRLRIDLQLADKVTYNTLKSIGDNEVNLKMFEFNLVDDAMFISKYHTGKKIMKLWEQSLQVGRLSPYYQDGTYLYIGGHKLLTAHIAYNKIRIIKQDEDTFKPQHLNSIMIPKIDEALSRDQITLKNPNMQAYMKKLNEVYSKKIVYNDSYKKIQSVIISNFNIEDGIINLIFKITGEDLLSIFCRDYNIKLRVEKVFSLNNQVCKGSYDNYVECLSSSNEEVILRKCFEPSIFNGNSVYSLTLMAIRGTEIEFDIAINSDSVIDNSGSACILIADNNKLLLGTRDYLIK